MRPLPIRTQEVIYRVAQECLQNIVKHSEASRCNVNVWLRAADKISSWAFSQRRRRLRDPVKGKGWLRLGPWVNSTASKRQELNQLFPLNRRVFKVYLWKESRDRLWTCRYEGAILNYLQPWIDQHRGQRLKPSETGGNVAGPPGWNPELLPDEGTPGVVGAVNWKYKVIAAPRTRLQEPTLSA